MKQLNKEQRGYVYLIKSLDLYKIGRCSIRWSPSDTWTEKTKEARTKKGEETALNTRIGHYRTHNPHEVRLQASTLVQDCRSAEEALLNKWRCRSVTGDWFRFSPMELASVQQEMSEMV